MTARVRPVASLPGKRKNAGDPNFRVSTCKNCQLGVFKDQPHHWQTGRMTGLVHDNCEGGTA